MRMLFKEKLFSWFDSYDIYNEAGETLFEVKGQFAWGHKLKIYDGAGGRELGTVKEKVLSFLPRFEIYMGEQYVGCISKELSFFRPRFNIDCNGWRMEGDVFEWDYEIKNQFGYTIANVSKELFNWTDTYVIDVADPRDALCVLMLVLAIDAEKCSRSN